MDRLTNRQLRALLEFLQQCYAFRDRDAFVAHLLRALPQVIPSEVTSYAAVDPHGRLAEARVEPAHAAFPDAERIFEVHISEHPFTTHFQQTRNGHAIKISDFLTQRQFHRLPLYREFFWRARVEHQMAVLLSVPSPLQIVVALNRSRGDFSERDRLLLNLLCPHLVQAYCNAEAVTRMQADVALLQQALEGGGQGVVVLSMEGRVRLLSSRARAWLGAYFGGPARQGGRLPESLRSWAAHQDAQLSGAADVPPPREPLVVEWEGKRLVVRHLCEEDQCLLLLEERRMTLQPVSLEPLGLTRREADVLRWVAEGKTNTEIGTILGLSPRTVQKHLEHIYDKLGVETRTAAARLALTNSQKPS